MHLLEHVSYEPGSTETKTTSAAHDSTQDADATNLVITVTPDTSRVLVVLEGVCFAGGTAGDNVHVSWNLREAGVDLFSHQRIMRTVNPMRCRLSRVVEVSAGVERTWTWGHRSSSSTIAVNLRMGGAGTSAVGPAEMFVYSIAEGTEDLLALVQYDPDPAATPSQTTTSFADLDATNLAVTFDPPASELVNVELEAYAHVRQAWTLREGTTNLTADGSAAGMQVHGSSNIPGRVQPRFFIPVTGGTKTWKWGWRKVDASNALMFYGTDYGPAEMRVWAVDL